jgi:hypothetical protein
MNKEAILESWAPRDGTWSLWARPVLFAQMPETASGASAVRLTWDVSWAPAATAHAVLVVDLPGAESVLMGLFLAERGYRPIPLYNACTGPHEVIDQGAIIAALQAGAEFLAALPLRDAPPVFLLDADRMRPRRPIFGGDFDNRWQVFPQDFPSAAMLTERGFTRVVFIQRGSMVPQSDLAGVLRIWQEAGMSIDAKDVLSAEPPQPTRIASPPWYRQLWQGVVTMFGMQPKPSAGFGYVVPRTHG